MALGTGKIVTAQNKQPLGDIPPFKMLQTNGKFFSATDLRDFRPVVIIYFSPDCDHCQVLMKEVFKNISVFKNAEVVMISFRRLEDLKPFEKLYKTATYPNIKVGTEGNTFYLQKLFRIENTPFTAMYNSQHRLVSYSKFETPAKEILDQVSVLK